MKYLKSFILYVLYSFIMSTPYTTISLEEATELISKKQEDLMNEAEEFWSTLLKFNEKDTQELITQDEWDQADEILTAI